jgi:RNA polymerase sigma-70 factor (ECF subfamily)
MTASDNAERTNQEWLDALCEPGPRRDAALADLRRLLVRGLGYALASRTNVRDADLQDFAQEASLRILDNLDTFRGESRFLTWAQKIAVNVAFSELRRRRWRNVPLRTTLVVDDGEFVPEVYVDSDAGPEERLIQRAAVETLFDTIENELTEKQRRALLAVYIQGMPIVEVARRMDSNRNAMYKLIYDARQRLRQRLLEQGLSADEILAAFAIDREPTDT